MAFGGEVAVLADTEIEIMVLSAWRLELWM